MMTVQLTSFFNYTDRELGHIDLLLATHPHLPESSNLLLPVVQRRSRRSLGLLARDLSHPDNDWQDR